MFVLHVIKFKTWLSTLLPRQMFSDSRLQCHLGETGRVLDVVSRNYSLVPFSTIFCQSRLHQPPSCPADTSRMQMTMTRYGGSDTGEGTIRWCHTPSSVLGPPARHCCKCCHSPRAAPTPRPQGSLTPTRQEGILVAPRILKHPLSLLPLSSAFCPVCPISPCTCP